MKELGCHSRESGNPSRNERHVGMRAWQLSDRDLLAIREVAEAAARATQQRGRSMNRPLSSWKYEAGFLTIAHAGRSFDLGYFESREDARNAALAFFEKAASVVEVASAVARP